MNLKDKLESHYKSFNNLPNKQKIYLFTDSLLNLLFPINNSKIEFDTNIKVLKKDLEDILVDLNTFDKDTLKVNIDLFFESLSDVFDLLILDAQAFLDNDPAAKSLVQIYLSYPGFLAISIYRLANSLYKLDIPLIPRIMTEYAHTNTGIDIHPGATIAGSFFIDHGTGVVIGETCIINKNVTIYQGVTLGGKSVSKDLKNIKRHPTIKENVTIYANATVLGGETVVGKNSVVGGNVWLTDSIPENSKVYFVNEIKLKFD